MTTKLNELEQKIALVERTLADATKVNHAAGVELARTPSNPAALQAARDAAQKLAAVEADLDMLRSARVAAQAADSADTEAAARAKAAGHMLALDKRLADRIEAGHQVDATLAELKAALQKWVKCSQAAAAEASGFFRIALAENQLRRTDYSGHAGALVDAACNAVAAELSAACEGMAMHRTVTFNYLRHTAGTSELVAVDAESSGKVVQSRVRELARQWEL